jgi:triosephosphate isomerase (TIM)
MRRPIVAGNWKMYTTLASAKDLASQLRAKLADLTDRDVVLIPPFPFIEAVARTLEGAPIKVGAQECRPEPEGAFTGDVSIPMIKSAGAAYCLVGHSERREYHGETNAGCNGKVKALLAAEVTPIYCIGEKLDVRDAGGTLALVEKQIREGLAGLTPEQAAKIVVAYEPVWAIGTGRVATPEQAQEVHAHIRKVLAAIFGAQVAGGLRIQYGGSVKPDNVDELMACPDIDGALVGGASLKADSFARIVKFV